MAISEREISVVIDGFIRSKFGTTKVQLGAASADGAVSAEPQDCSFPEKIKNSQ